MGIFTKKFMKKRNRSFLPRRYRSSTLHPRSVSRFASQWIDASPFDTRVSYSVFFDMGRVLKLRSYSRNPSTFPSVGDPFCSDGFVVQSTLPSGVST